ncbi:MAG: hypothetical protein AB7K04_13955 [Pseudorhodoplanes sp.]
MKAVASIAGPICRAGLAALLCVPASATLAAGNCSFKKQPPVILKNMGPCNFDVGTLSFEGDPVQQAKCLVTKVEPFGKLGERRETLPDSLANVGTATGLPAREALRELLEERGLGTTLGARLPDPVSHAHDNDPLSRSATYFLIHDTSAPNFRNRRWPADVNTDPGINRLARYACANKIERAHVFINRMGEIFQPHDFSVPWRATKFEMAVEFGSALKGLTLHVELVQPRMPEPGRGRSNDYRAPSPGFPPAQYDALALVYTVASVRAGFWLIPVFHAVIDEGIYNKHDDPQNFELDDFAASLAKLRENLSAIRVSEPKPD